MHAALPLAALVVAVSLLVGPGAERSTDAAPPTAPPYVAGEVIVALDAGVSAETAGIDRASVVGITESHVTVKVPEGEEARAIEELSGRDGVRYAELNTLSQPALVPNDAQYPMQWGMPMIGIEPVWEDTLGDGVTIAVIDTGVAFENWGEYVRSPQLSRAQFAFPYDATTGSTHPNDTSGHGTHITGTLAQDTGDGVGPAGIAPEAQIIPIKVCLPFGCPASAMAGGVRWAVDHGANIINVSLGGQSISRAEREAYAYAEQHGVLVVAAAGNGGADFIGDDRLNYPAALETVVAVGAVLMDGTRAPYSNFSGEGRIGLHLVAPGGSIATDINGDGQPDGILQETFAHACGSATVDYGVFTSCLYHGTSMAAPHVSGTAALLLSLFPSLTPAEVRTALGCSAADLGPPGADAEYGAGLVRADVAVRDTDGDERPDCLEEPTSFVIDIGDFDLPPGAEFSAPLWGNVTGQGLSAYEVTVHFDASVLQLTGCAPLEGECEQSPGSVTVSGRGSQLLNGQFRLADLRFRVIGMGGAQSPLSIDAGASPSSASDPRPVVFVQSGQVNVVSPPNTVFGDTDCNGQVGDEDLILMLRELGGGLPSICSAEGDVDCSGELDLPDVRLLLHSVAGIPKTPPAGCPLIGSF